MKRSPLRLVAVFAVFLTTSLGAPDAADAGEAIKIATIAPKASIWGRFYSTWADAVKQKSEGRLELEIFYNGVQGDEGSMIGKMKSGQLDAAALTSVGLSKIYKPILALQLPGLFRSWEKLDAARDALRGELEKGVADAGFTLGGWGDVGVIHGMTKGIVVRVPEDLRSAKPLTWRDDVIGPTLHQIIGRVNGVPLSAPEVLSALGTGAVNVVNAPALAAEQLQWTSKLDHISEEGAVYAIGAMVFRSKRLEELSPDLRQILSDTGKVAVAGLSAKIRKEDAAAFERLKGRMTVVKLTEAERAKWRDAFIELAKRLGQGTFSPDLLKRLVELSR